VNLAEITRRGAHEPIHRLTRLEIILDDLEGNGDYSLDIDFLRIQGLDGNVAWQEDFAAVTDWNVAATFANRPDGADRFGFRAVEEDHATLGRMTLTAISSNALEGPIDEATRFMQPRDGVDVLRHAEFHEESIPILLKREDQYFLNTYSPTEECWEALIPRLLGAPLQQGVMFQSYSFGVRESGITSHTDTQWTVIQEEELPIDRVRLVAPPEWNEPLPVTLPVSSGRWSCRVIQGERSTIVLPDSDSSPAEVTLQPGEVVDLLRKP